MPDPTNTTPVPAVPAAPAPGYKSTEFWLTAVTAIVALVNGSGVLHFQIPVDTVTHVLAAVVAYAGSRSIVKAVAAYSAGKDYAGLNK